MSNLFKFLLICVVVCNAGASRAQQVVRAQEPNARVAPPGEKLIFTITPFNLKGREVVRWENPQLASPPDSPPYRIVIGGLTPPGTVVLLDEQVPIAVDERGRFQFILEMTKPQAITEFQAITPTGITNNYIISLELPGKKDQPRSIVKKVAKGPPSPDYTVPLNFDPAQNGVIVQPQAFEYALFPTSDFSLGNVVVRSTDINLSVLRNKKAKAYNLRFQWPRVFMSEGQIEIKNSANKTLWSRTISLGEGKKLKSPKGDKTKTVDDILVYQSLPLPNLNAFKRQKDLRFCMKGPKDLKSSF
ncbi:MAG TPA: hypothetical protein VFV50_15465, partial [Bdellovibrionales bacterium]|nr:hypothetical protein [Bdellovibrionales bacterium]